MMTPKASRPTMPGYGILPEGQGSGLLDWAWASRRLAASHDYWLVSVRPDHRPHVVPVWGVFLDDRVWLSSGPRSRKVANLRQNPAVAVTTDEAFTPVIAEGDAQEMTDLALIERFATAMDTKYETEYGVEFYTANVTFSIRPARVIGIDGEDFTGSATRWTFRGG